MPVGTIPIIEAQVTLLSAEEGGRKWPLRLSLVEGTYRPHLVVGDPHQRRALVNASGFGTEEYLGVQFLPASSDLGPGETAVVRMYLMFYDNAPAVYERLIPGATFTIREGAKVVGYGRVLTR